MTWSEDAVSVAVCPTDVLSHLGQDDVFDQSEHGSDLVGEPEDIDTVNVGEIHSSDMTPCGT